VFGSRLCFRDTLVNSAALAAIAAPSWALAQGNSNNTPAAQNANGLPFTANDPPLSSYPGQGQGPPSLPQPFGGSFPPGCSILAMDKDDLNQPNGNGDDKKAGPGNPNCQPASP
jgi:hypothetical protein